MNLRGDDRRPAPLPGVAVVTLTHNSRRFIDGYFRALARIEYPHTQVGVHVLDNGSSDDSYGYIAKTYCRDEGYPLAVRIRRVETNVGFAEGNNIVLRELMNKTGPEAFMLLNIDTEIEPKCLRYLAEGLLKDPRAGIIEALQQPREHPKWYDPSTYETGWCSCGGAMIRRAALEDVGLFDGKFFAYCEDVDLSWRMWLNGWKCKVEPKAKYTHYTEGLDAEKDGGVQLYYSVRNSFFMHMKYDSWRGVWRHMRFYKDAVREALDARTRSVLERAGRDWWRYLPALLVDRVRLSGRRRMRWIMFDGFNYERRRRYVDTEDGGRVIFDERR